jgi:hypothetical protein
MAKRINRNTSPPEEKTSGIGKNKELIETHDTLLKFSFKYLDLGHDKFTCYGKESGYFLAFIDRMKDLSFSLVSELKQSGRQRKGIRFHDIDWRDTSVAGFGIPNEEMVVDKPWQFSISANEFGRVHGFFIGNVFYIVWFDPDHILYS